MSDSLKVTESRAVELSAALERVPADLAPFGKLVVRPTEDGGTIVAQWKENKGLTHQGAMACSFLSAIARAAIADLLDDRVALLTELAAERARREAAESEAVAERSEKLLAVLSRSSLRRDVDDANKRLGKEALRAASLEFRLGAATARADQAERQHGAVHAEAAAIDRRPIDRRERLDRLARLPSRLIAAAQRDHVAHAGVEAYASSGVPAEDALGMAIVALVDRLRECEPARLRELAMQPPPAILVPRDLAERVKAWTIGDAAAAMELVVRSRAGQAEPLTTEEREELAGLQHEMQLRSLGDRPSAPSAEMLRRLLELEARAARTSP